MIAASPDRPALPELSERDADPHTAAIYREIRRLGGVPMVALVFRHLATLPGGLDWAWQAIGPAWRTGLLQETAWQLAQDTRAGTLGPLTTDRLDGLGVDAAARVGLRTVTGAYNRANPLNLLSTICLLHLVDGASARAAIEARAWTPPTPHGPLPPMVDPAAMPDRIVALLQSVSDTPASADEPRLVPSLYRHLVHHPQYLGIAIAALRERVEDGSLERSVADVQARAAAAAASIVARLSAPPAPDPAIRPALERFGGGVIARMIVIGALLESALPAED